jgi:hypothetical protein
MPVLANNGYYFLSANLMADLYLTQSVEYFSQTLSLGQLFSGYLRLLLKEME